jgi:hypothetical protein
LLNPDLANLRRFPDDLTTEDDSASATTPRETKTENE